MTNGGRIQNVSGFTLIEVLIGVSIATFLITVMVSLHISNLNVFKGTSDRSTLNQDALLVVDFLRNEIMGVGGGSMRGWQGVWEENNCLPRAFFPNCAGSDRVTLTTVRSPLQECTITGMVNPGLLQIANSPGYCCITPAAAGEISFAAQPVMLTLNDYYSQKFVTSVDLVTCQVSVVSGQASGNDRPPPGAPTNWSGGTIGIVQVETLYWDSMAKTLRRFTDLNGNNTQDPDEDVIVADNVFDFQMALGYDFNIADGNITETANGINDEWLYNAPTLPEFFGTPPFVGSITPSQLLLVEVGVILGTADPTSISGANTARVFDGPLRTMPGFTLRPESAKVAPRNSYIFQ